MSARDAILRAIAEARPAAVAPPDVRAIARAFPKPDGDVAGRFGDAARAAGARVVEAAGDDLARVAALVGEGARSVLSRLAAVPSTVAADGDPRRLAALDLFVCQATLGVAENGAVWLPASALGERAALFLAAHVLVALDRSSVVPDLHAAYERIDLGGEPFGVLVAGPSKTADIEQSLVVGAHGPKGLTVVLLD
ncbi:MAG TPA: LUD domain-containing protein [Gemmatimonadaceae bacterium]|nr:LUD domain-containing protein [Gemmatimonadaceae bacterium]